MIEEEGLVSVDDFERRLKNYEKDALDLFMSLHPRFSQGASFYPYQDMKASDVYLSTTKRLAEKGYAGIVVLWDEFGRYLERSLENPKGNECLELQEFAEECNDSYLHETKLFFFLLAHRERQEYLGLVKAKLAIWNSEAEKRAYTEDIQKVQKRFHSEIRMKTNDTEIYDLIDHVVIQKVDEPIWEAIRRKEIFNIWLDKCVEAKIFPECGKEFILNTIIKGAYPLHPVTTCCLPKLSEKVAQNERTLFQFLCKDEPNSVNQFIRNSIEDNVGNLNVICVDKLFDYFKEEARRSEKTKRMVQEYLNIERLLGSSPSMNKRVAKAIVVLNIASDEFLRLKTTPTFIGFALNTSVEEVSTSLELMSSRNNGERILVKNNADGTYRFYGAGVIDIDEEIDKIVTERLPIANPIRLLQGTEGIDDATLAERMGLPQFIEAKSYNDDFRMNRAIDIKFVDVKEVEMFRGTPNDGIIDGTLLFVLGESERELTRATESVKNIKEFRVLVAIPRQTIMFSNIVRKIDAMERLRKERKEIFGEGGTFEEEWRYKYEEHMDLLKNVFVPLLNPERGLADYYFKGEPRRGITSKTKLEGFASEIMREAYPYTPLVTRDELIRIDGNDTFRKHRKPVIDNIFRGDGPSILAREVNAPVKAVVKSVLEVNKVLAKKKGSYVIEKPSENECMVRLWDQVDEFVLSSKISGKPAVHMINMMISPPFGLRRRSIPVFLAAILRKYVLRGNITIKEKELPHNKIDSEIIELVVSNPEKYTIVYKEVGEAQRIIIDGLCEAYGLEAEGELGERIVASRDNLIKWWQGLPIFARKTKELTREAQLFSENVVIPLSANEVDVKQILFERFPEAIGLKELAGKSLEKQKADISEKVKNIKSEFEGVVNKLKDTILKSYKEVFGGGKNDDPINVLISWRKGLGKKRELIIDGDAGKLLETARSLESKDDKTSLIDLVDKITGSKPENWNGDTFVDEFKGQLKNIRRMIEGYSLPSEDEDSASITLRLDGNTVTRNFKKAKSVSQIGKSMANLINAAIKDLGSSLPEEEKYTVIIEVLKDNLR